MLGFDLDIWDYIAFAVVLVIATGAMLNLPIASHFHRAWRRL